MDDVMLYSNPVKYTIAIIQYSDDIIQYCTAVA